ncbi:MAG: SDR family NAD(P)-dependent oxidoreductase [Desulfotignum sp.]|jgi:acyl transferase domain-containing protein/NAD(P)-dependent dehydrogenase (short-subunit alcohol dehydrogenase family)/3-hydroxymyristoyl/3-hydroxydecanoyl-(acyl carrier protein) dehydratase/acyl carrier protein|nr:SDR family NAD(P)-dependent oxidoreductase [Desulfotignum sp.]
MRQDTPQTTDIAIIGMGCIFPGSFHLKDFWHLLFNGTDAIADIPEDTHWQITDFFDPDPSRPDHIYCRRGGFIPKISFDPAAFGIPPNNITATDTAQLLGLEVAKMALEDAGYPKEHPFLTQARVNVILGVTGTQELVIPLGARLGHPIWKNALDAAGIAPEQKKQVLDLIQSSYAQWQENSFPGLLGNVVAGRIANRFNLSGTNSVSDAACASSLSALHTAVMELTAHKCDMSITGGVDCLNDIFMHMCFARTGVLSHTSDARPFSRDADGTVLGEGIGMLVLKRLADAQKDKDRIYAVIKGMGTSSDGKTSAIYAPDAKGQQKALQDAYGRAGIDPASVAMIEAHGTGTRVGDKVEFSALSSCFGAQKEKNSIAIGSVKSMIGHTKAAAGAAGIIKAALALHHKVILPTLKADIPDPELDINNSAFYLNNRSKPWVPASSDTGPRRAGISAFGFGGSNFHAVLEEHNAQKTHVSWDGSVQIAAFSAPDTPGLLEKLKAFEAGITPDPGMDGGETSRLIAWHAAASRKSFSPDQQIRLLMVLHRDTDPRELLDQARTVVEKQGPSREQIYYGAGPVRGKLGFLFPGQGSQYPDMGKDLFAVFPEAMEALNLAQKIFKEHASDTLARTEVRQELTDFMFALPGHVQDRSVSESALRHTQVAQVAIGAVSLAMTLVLRRFGILPHMACGHSFGELSAMQAAGWIDNTTLLTLAAVRGKHMAAAGRTGSDSGSMLAVQADMPAIEALLSDLGLDLVLANRNSPNQGVVSGPTPDIEKAARACRKQKIRAVKLPVAAAFHSHLVADAAKPFNAFAADQAIAPTDIQVLSNTTGKPYGTDPEKIRSVLGHQLMHPVRFMENIETMHKNGVSLFVEAGPKTVLTGLVNRILDADTVTAKGMDDSCGKKSGLADLAGVLCTIAAKGFCVDLTQWEDPVKQPEPKRMRVLLSGANPRPTPMKAPAPVNAASPVNETAPCKTPAHTTATKPGSENTPETPKPLESAKLSETGKPLESTKTPAPGKMPAPEKKQVSTNKNYNNPAPVSQQARPDTPGALQQGYSMHTPSDMHPSAPQNAMHLVLKGLESMQALQAQTARTHEKFLETQSQASHALAAIMEQTRQFMAAPGTPSPGPALGSPSDFQSPSPAPRHTSFSQTPPGRVNGEIPQQMPQTPFIQAGAAPSHVPPASQADAGRHDGTDSRNRATFQDHSGLPDETAAHDPASGDPGVRDAGLRSAEPHDVAIPEAAAPKSGMTDIQAVLFGTVSRLTGFPEEMLEPSMDIESDLGIDSIKKVEIISELEKHLPDTTGLSTESIGSVRTLSDICQAIAAQAPAPDAGPGKISGTDKTFEAQTACSTQALSHAPQPADCCSTQALSNTQPPADTKTHGESAPGGDTLFASKNAADPGPDAAPVGGAPQTPEITKILVDTISELTGFPEEMLEPGMNLESDLGIDSIKRVEILSRLEQALGDGAGGLSGEAMAKLETIQDIVHFLEKTAPETQGPVKKNPFLPEKQPKDAKEPPDLIRREIVLTPYPIQQIRFFNGSRIQVPENKKIYITRDQPGVARLLEKEFTNQGLAAELIDIGSENMPELPDAAGIVIVQDKWNISDAEAATDFIKCAFALVHKNAVHLMASARQKGAFLTTICFSGGSFGFGDAAFATHPVYGGLAGLAKTARLEWQDVLCHALDMPCDMKACKTLAEPAAALMMTNGAVEMGLFGDNCMIPALKVSPVKKGKPGLTAKDVVVISGGAKGVTAACAAALAKACRPAIALLGRSPAPVEEPQWAQDITDPARLKKAILTHAFTGQKPRPADVEKLYQAICAGRQIRRTLDLIRSHGAQAAYWSTDIRDTSALHRTMQDIRQRFGPITAVIHGAGVLEDKLIPEKKPEQFNRVFDTKVAGLHNLVDATAADPLKHMILFSSIAARTGNPGQCDYAMANEVLNKTAGRLAQKNPGCRYLAINWGPWDGGMVHDGLKREFAKKGVGLIPLAAGCSQLLLEMENTDPYPVEIVITAPGRDQEKKAPVLSQVTELAVSRDNLPVLDSHRINHEPVVPFALLAEVMAHAAEKNNPGLVFAGIDDMRLLKGIRPKDSRIDVAVNLGKCTPADTGYTALASLTSAGDGGQAHTHTTATVILKDTLPEPPVISAWGRMDLAPAKISAQKAYETILFHGQALQAIDAVTGISSKGIAVTASPAPPPDQWFTTPLQKNWVTDPLLLDAAFQAAIIWTWETRGQVCLPAFFANLRIYASFHRPQNNGNNGNTNARNRGSQDNSAYDKRIHILFTVNENTEHSIKGYFTFLDADNTVVLSITGFEAVVDSTLHKKFKPLPLFDRPSILEFAEGSPSAAFGEKYTVFDKERQIARLPRPPYFFMDRVLTADHAQWVMQPGGWIETQYDVPEDAWYFAANRTDTMPFCILLEIALQPCGWLAAYAGSALHSDARLHFRNLGGKAVLQANLTKDAGSLTIRTRMTDVSTAGGMIIQNFVFQVINKGQMVYQGTTSFGFFSAQALAEQKGIRKSLLVTDNISSPQNTAAFLQSSTSSRQENSSTRHSHNTGDFPDTETASPYPDLKKAADHCPEPVMIFTDDAPLTPDDLHTSPDTGMPAKALRMIDTIDVMDMDGGIFSKGYIRAARKNNPEEWFYDAHFYQDPVCPGSLGIESFLQTMRCFLVKKYGIDPVTYTPRLISGQTHEWIYRGQIVPSNRQIQVHTHIRESAVVQKSGTGTDGYEVVADGALTVDGICIYEMKNFGVAFIPVP